MQTKDLVDNLYEVLMSALDKSDGDELTKFVISSLNRGEKTYYRKNIAETKNFDEEWITVMESYFPSIDRIIKNPPTALRYDEEVVAVEKARKINSASVRHLASHTQNIRDINKGIVTPKKILTTFSEQEEAIYENRFIKTLIKRAQIFVQNRYIVIKDNVESYQKDHLNYKTEFDVQDTQVSMNVDLVLRKDLDNKKINQHNQRLLARVERLNLLVNGFAGSPFIQRLAKAKAINPPIMKTNIILKNPDFKNAYSLWLFLDRYSSLGYDTSVKEKNIPLTDEMNKLLSKLTLLTYVGTLYNTKNRKLEDFEDYQEKIRKGTKIAKTNIDDIVERPNEIVLSDSVINETYLNEYKKMFNKKVKEYDDESASHDTSLKKAVRDIIAISNAIFDSVFELEEEEDYFKRLVEEKDYEKEYELAKEKLKHCKMVREAKEIDYKSAVKREKALLKEMQKANNQMIRANSQKLKDEAFSELHERIRKEQEILKKNKERLAASISESDSKLDEVSSSKEKLSKEKIKMNLYIKEQSKKIANEEKAKLRKALLEVEAKHQAKLEAERKQEEIRKQKAKQKAKEREEIRRKKAKEEAKKRLEKIRAEERAKRLRRIEAEKKKKLGIKPGDKDD